MENISENIKKALDMLNNNETGVILRRGEFRGNSFSVLKVVKNAIVMAKFSDYHGQSNLVLAAKLNNKIIGNSSQFSENELPYQTELAKYIPVIPFNVILQAKLDLNKFTEIDKGNEETITRKITNIS